MLTRLIPFAALALIAAPSAVAAPPGLAALTLGAGRHAAATFTAPRASSVTIYFASKPDRATDGKFLAENIEHVDFMTDGEIQAGRWLDESQLDPGTYWVLLNASPDFDSCYLIDQGGYDPACADGFSNVVQFTVPKPRTRYSVAHTLYTGLKQVDLELRATPLGEKRAYKVCWRQLNRRVRCLSGLLNGYSWETGDSDSLSVPTRLLATRTTFTWTVGSAAVARKTVRIR